MAKRQQWIIKDRQGRVKGPFSTEQVVDLINAGHLDGEEEIARYPGTEWFPITQDPQFYDKLIEILSAQPYRPEDGFEELSKKPHSVSDVSEPIHESKPKSLTSDPLTGDEESMESDFGKSEAWSQGSIDSELEEADDFEPVEFKKDDQSYIDKFGGSKNRIQKQSPSRSQEKKDKKVSSQSQQGKSKKVRSQTQTGINPYESDEYGSAEVIELIDRKKANKKAKKKAAKGPLVLIVLLLVAAIFVLLPNKNNQSTGRFVHLVFPLDQQDSTNEATTSEELAKKAMGYFLTDTFEGYAKAQSFFSRSILKKKENHEAWSLLCLTYAELWPYSYQDVNDQKVVMRSSQSINALAPNSIYSQTCKVVNLYLLGRLQEADSEVNKVLNDFETNSQQPPVTFYFLKSLILAALEQYGVAHGYMTTAKELWPAWVRLSRLEADIYYDSGQMGYAINLYTNILKQYPLHIHSRIMRGLILKSFFHKDEQAFEELSTAVAQKQVIENTLKSKVFLILAEGHSAHGDGGSALKYAKEAYSLNPTSIEAQNLLRALGGGEQLKNVKYDIRQLIIQGDRYFRQSEFSAAQGLYKQAFELDPKSGLAAMKAGQALWERSFTVEAVEWLNKAIVAQPDLIEAYVVLARFQAIRFEFERAHKVLNKARQVNPKSFEVLKGFAEVELIRKSPDGAISFAKKALTIFESDVETNVLLAKAYMMKQDYQKAFTAANRATEIDVNNIPAQIEFGKSLGGLQGADVALEFFTQRIQTYPYILEYRMALGELLLNEERYDDAAQIYEDILLIKPTNKKSLVQLGRVLRQQGKMAEASKRFLRAAVLDPSDTEALFELGILYLMINKPKYARKQFLKVADVNQRFPLVHYYIGKASLLLGDYKEALVQAEEERKYNPYLPESFVLAAETHMKLREFGACAKNFQEAIRRYAEDGNNYIKAAKCYRLGNNLVLAEQLLKEASRRESGNPEIYKEQGALYEMQGNSEQAIYAYRQYLELRPNAEDRPDIEKRLINLGDSGE